MEIFKLHREIQSTQIKLLEQYLTYIKLLNICEMRLAGQISNTDLLLNEVLTRVNELNKEDIIEEQQYVYERILLKKYAQNALRNNEIYKNIFSTKDINEVEKRLTKFLNKNRELNELQEQMESIFDYIENKDKNGTE